MFAAWLNPTVRGAGYSVGRSPSLNLSAMARKASASFLADGVILIKDGYASIKRKYKFKRFDYKKYILNTINLFSNGSLR